jgi:hypothetical protein
MPYLKVTNYAGDGRLANRMEANALANLSLIARFPDAPDPHWDQSSWVFRHSSNAGRVGELIAGHYA